MHEGVAGLRARGAGRQSGPRRARQLRYSQASQGVGLARAPSALHLPLHPTSGSWANAVEGLFAKLTRHRLKRGVFTSIVELQATINRFIAETNDMPKPFVWTKSADAILAAMQRGRQALEAIHSHVRLCQMQASELVACEQALVFGLYQAGQEARSLKRRLIIL
jgi:hypothetical protein